MNANLAQMQWMVVPRWLFYSMAGAAVAYFYIRWRIKRAVRVTYRQINLSIDKLERFPFKRAPDRSVQQHLTNGQPGPAVVISTAPLLVAAYSKDLDAVAMLHFDDDLATEYQLKPGSRLLSINGFANLPAQPDLTPGPGASGKVDRFHPIIADFVSDNIDPIRDAKSAIRDDQWVRAEELGRQYAAVHGETARDGSPLEAMFPAV